jgi:phospholipid/cholesterol/gamma-HCH transport system substrate-binding protein
VGVVQEVRRLDAVVTLQINPRFNRIPDDSDASILTAGLLGSKYVGIGPGGAETYLKDQSELEMTQSAVVLEQLIGKFLFSQGEKKDESAPSSAPSPAAPDTAPGSPSE